MLDKTDDKKMVIQSLDSGEMTDDQIIDLLLLILDDWEVRAAVMRAKNKYQSAQTITTQIEQKKSA
jgi:hypothetical protein